MCVWAVRMVGLGLRLGFGLGLGFGLYIRSRLGLQLAYVLTLLCIFCVWAVRTGGFHVQHQFFTAVDFTGGLQVHLQQWDIYTLQGSNSMNWEHLSNAVQPV